MMHKTEYLTPIPYLKFYLHELDYLTEKLKNKVGNV